MLIKSITERKQQKTVILYHGTQIENLRPILKHGLLANPPKKAWGKTGDAPGSESFHGVYASARRQEAAGAGRDAAARLHTQYPDKVLLVTLQYVIGSGDIDEDTISEMLRYSTGNWENEYNYAVKNNKSLSELYKKFAIEGTRNFMELVPEHGTANNMTVKYVTVLFQEIFKYLLENPEKVNGALFGMFALSNFRAAPNVAKAINDLMRNIKPTYVNDQWEATSYRINMNVGFKGKTRILKIETFDLETEKSQQVYPRQF